MLDSLFAGAGASGWNVSLLLLLAKATIILVAALGITMAMQRASAGARHLVWLVTLGTLLLVPALTAWAPLTLRVLPPASTRESFDVSRTGTPAPVPNPVALPAPMPEGNSGVAVPPTREQTNPGVVSRMLAVVAGMSAISIVLTIWLTVVLAIVASLAWATLTVRRIVRQSRPLDTEDWLTPLWEVADRMGLDEVPRLLRSADSKMPFACGITTPTIVLPAESDNWTLDRRRAVLLHELAHVRRHDLLGHTLGRLVCAIYWFHPLVWTAARKLRSESERACDDLALSCGTRATDYAEHLLEIVTSVRRDSTPSVALAMARRKEFEGRMLAILDPELLHSSPSRRQSTVLIATLALISITVGAASPVRRESPARVATDVPAAQDVAVAPEPADTPMRASLPVRIPADTDVHQFTTQSTSVRTSSSTSPVESIAQGTASLTQDAMRLGISVGTSAAAKALGSKEVSDALASASGITGAVLQGLLGGVAVKSGKSDERPILLARVLRSDSSASLRKIAAWGLHEYADSPVAAEALSNAVRRDSDARVREMAAWSLGHSDDRNAGVTEALGAALEADANDQVRGISAWALGNIGDRSATEALVVGLSDASESVRRRAAWALGNVEPKEAPRALVAMLKDEDAHVRTVVAWALYRIEDPSSAPALEAALKAEQDKDVQLSMIRALASLGEKSVDAIKGLIESPDPRVKAMAVRALAGGRATGPWPWPWPEPRPFP